MGQKYPGSMGVSNDFTAIDSGTSVLGRSSTPGPVCATEDPNVLQRTGYVLDAWEIAKNRYARASIISHTEQDFYEIIQGAVPMLLMACGLVLTTTIIGAGVGGVLGGGVGAMPGAAAGFAFGTTILEVLGLAFLAVFLKDRLGDIGDALYTGATMAWKSCGDPTTIDLAAKRMAESIGLFYAALLQALLLYLGSALASRTLAASRTALRDSKLFQSCEKLEAWLNKNFAELYQKHLGKPAPGILPPGTRSLEEWTLYIQQLELKAPQRDKGILWSKLGDQGERAAKLASDRGLTSLEMLLKDTGFPAAYEAAFGKLQDGTTRAIWKQISEKYARSLQGRVIGFVDDQALLKAIKESPVKPFKDLAPGEPAITKAPQITNELMEISSVMERNPNISIVEIRDIANPDVTIKTMFRTSVLQSKAAPLQ